MEVSLPSCSFFWHSGCSLMVAAIRHNTVCGASQIYKKNSDFHKPELPSLLQTID